MLTFNVGTAWLEPKGWLENTEKGREQLLAKLDGTVLEGATDLGAALDALVKPSFEISKETPVNVFLLSDGAYPLGTAESVAKSNPGKVPIHCIDLAGGAGGDDLRKIARDSGGQYAPRGR